MMSQWSLGVNEWWVDYSSWNALIGKEVRSGVEEAVTGLDRSVSGRLPAFLRPRIASPTDQTQKEILRRLLRNDARAYRNP